MTIITVKDRTDTQSLLARLQTWQRDAKKYGQNALYDLLYKTCVHIRRQEKALADTGRPLKPSRATKPMPRFPTTSAPAQATDANAAAKGIR